MLKWCVSLCSTALLLLGSSTVIAQTSSFNCTNPPEDCNFYSVCVENMDSCGPNGYAIGYGQHYCQLFGSTASLFSSKGQKWIHAVRQCLLQELVPEMALNPLPTCSALQTYAFNSHVKCYTAPSSSDPSVTACNLPFTDYLALFYTIRAAVFDETKLTLTQGVEVLQVCGSNLVSSAAVDLTLPTSFLTSSSIRSSFSSSTALENAICNSLASYVHHSASSMVCALITNHTTQTLSLSVSVIPSLSLTSPAVVVETIVNAINNGQLTTLTVTGDLTPTTSILLSLTSSSASSCTASTPCFTTSTMLQQLTAAPAGTTLYTNTTTTLATALPSSSTAAPTAVGQTPTAAAPRTTYTNLVLGIGLLFATLCASIRVN